MSDETKTLQSHINTDVKKDIEQLYAHAKVANNEMGDIKVSMIQISTDVDWLKRSYWVVATASFGGLIGAVINLLAK